ncbi:farnesylcysteine lyase-like [Hibiscus syriacus]|uniref:farnesylcysteine lyase-like n=1 Tax=Hibiscus syriacus TaxID=106335 RepID=UPI0019212AFF|nr:farnesylcysteine lyase-like [Hibiscus syriacus]
MAFDPKSSFSFLIFLLLSIQPLIFCLTTDASPPPTVCIVGSGIGGSSVAHFLRHYFHPIPSQPNPPNIIIFERRSVVGGRMATVSIGGETWAGALFSDPLVSRFWLKGQPPPPRFVECALQSTVDSFLKYYESPETRPVFETVDEMLKWAGLYNLTTRTLQDELVHIKISPLMIDELVTVITRINYGQSVSISGLAGAVSLAGSGGGLWAIEGGNYQMAAGLIKSSNVSLHLNEEIESISYLGEYYELNSTKGNSYSCDVAVVATPLDEVSIQLTPSVSIPARKLQHTHATFVRGILNPAYFGLRTVGVIPELVGTLEDPDIPFSSISILKQHDENDTTYKVFSREPMTDALLDTIFSARLETVRINWGAYPHYEAPEVFAPFILDGQHLYYVNTFENAASTMETSAVAAENVARLILSRYFSEAHPHSSNLKSKSPDAHTLHTDL